MGPKPWCFLKTAMWAGIWSWPWGIRSQSACRQERAFPRCRASPPKFCPGGRACGLTVNGVETLVEWEPAASQSCGLLLTNQGETRVNSALSVWQTDGIIEETSLDGAFAGPVLPVEEGCLAVAISPAGELSAGWDS